VLVALADGLVGVSVGDPVALPVGVGVGVGPGDVLGTPDVAETGWLGVAEAFGERQSAAVRGSADETAAAILEFGAAFAVADGAVVAGWHLAVADELGDTVPVARALASAVPWPPVAGAPVPFPAGEPWPSVPPPPDDWPPVSTLAVTCPMACRSGGTATATIPKKAMAASTPAGRSQLMPVPQLAPGHAADRCRWRAWGRGAGEEAGQAQCPRQTQYRARLTAPLTTLSSHGWGGRRLVLARIRSSASAPGSTRLTAVVNSRRRRVSRSPRGTVISSPPRPWSFRPLAVS